MDHYLQYWRLDTLVSDLHIDGVTADFRFTHVGGEQLGALKRGDILWFVAMEFGKTYLVGRMEIDVIVSRAQAARILKIGRLPAAKYYAIARPGTESALTNIDISESTSKMRFLDAGERLPAVILDLSKGGIRRLDPRSSSLLERAWAEHRDVNTDLIWTAKKTAGESKPKRDTTVMLPKVIGQVKNISGRRAVEIHAMKTAQTYYEENGYSVEDVSSNRPYDLICNKGRSTLLVEVKGMQADGSTVNLTRNEVAIAQDPVTKTALFVLHSVKVVKTKKAFIASGGFIRVINPWSPADEHLTPTQYTYRVPGLAE